MDDKELQVPFTVRGKPVNTVKKEQELIKPFDIKEDVDPNKLEYIVLYDGEFDGEEVKSYHKVTGRKAVYEFIKSIIMFIDIEASIVLSEKTTIKDALNVKDFMSMAKVHFFSDDADFDINDYIIE